MRVCSQNDALECGAIWTAIQFPPSSSNEQLADGSLFMNRLNAPSEQSGHTQYRNLGKFLSGSIERHRIGSDHLLDFRPHDALHSRAREDRVRAGRIYLRCPMLEKR